MRILENWQYKFVEKSLFNYYTIKKSTLQTEKLMVKAIEEAKEWFKGTTHEAMMVEYYFNADKHRRNLTQAGHYTWVCENVLFLEEPSGYVIRREIVYRIAMNCYALGLFKL